MAGASIEATLELWALGLREVKARLRPLFREERMASSAGLFLDGLLGEERRKTGWMRAQAAGDPGPWRQQAVLGRAHWDADALRDVVRDYVVEHLAAEDAVLVVDETGFLKQGKSSCGVARQYTGSAGKITNCQIGVFAACVSSKGHAFIDRALYLPIAWVAADSVHGVGELETALRRAGKGYVLGVNATHRFGSWNTSPPIAGTAEAIAQKLDEAAWHRLPAGAGTKGARLHDWAYCASANLEAAEYNNSRTGTGTRGFLIRRTVANGDLAFFSTWCPAGTTIETLVRVEGHRRAIEDSFETAKNELGLDHNETRSWHGWHRHVSLVMLAFAMMAVVRHKANTLSPPPKTLRRVAKLRRA